MAKRPTMHDVAAAAGVSQAAVSLVLSGNSAGRASESTAQRVRDAAAKLGYRTNLQAKTLKTGVAEIIGMVGDEVATSPFSGDLIKGAQDRAWRDGNAMMTIDTGRDDRLRSAALETLLSHQVRGILFTLDYHRETQVPEAALEVRTVCLNGRDVSGRVPSVVPDEERGGHEATTRLLDAGHTRIGMINIYPTETLPAARDRRRGYTRALIEAGLDPDPSLVIPGEGGQADGERGTRALLALPEPPTAIFCGNDRTALGAYQALQEMGLRVPEDVSIVGFDDQDVLQDFFHPPLTTMRLPYLAMGELAAALVLDPSSPAEVHAVHCPAILRGSVAPQKGRSA